MPVKLYPVVIHAPDVEGGDFGALFPDFPGFTNGPTVEDVLARASEALEAAFEHLISEGEEPPAPTPVAAIPADMREGMLCVSLVPVSLPGRSKRVAITLPEDLIERIDATASNRSRFLAEAAEDRLRRG